MIDFFVKYLIAHTDAQIAYSCKAKNYMEQYMGARNCYALLNTVNTDFVKANLGEIETNNLEKKSKMGSSDINLLFVGVVEERKKIKELIDVVSNKQIGNKKITLNVVGGGDFLESLTSYVADLKINNVIFHGPIYDQMVLKKFYFQADLFVLPGDGGLGILQAMLYGLPCICCSADGTEEDYFGDLKHLRIFKNYEDILPLLARDDVYQRVDVRKFLEIVGSDIWAEKLSELCRSLLK